MTIDFAPFLAAARLLYEGPWVFERYAAVGGFIESHPGAALPVIETIITPGHTPHPSEVFRGMYRLQECKAKADAELAKVDLLLTPTAGTIYRIGEVEADPIRLNSNLGHYTNYMNLLDYAALAIPAARAGKLPFGVTLVGRAFDDGRLLEAARRFRLAEPYTVAVCGAHLAGMPLHSELEELGARFLGSAETAPRYRMYALEKGSVPKPALLRTEKDGTSFYVELYELSENAFARFARPHSASARPRHAGTSGRLPRPRLHRRGRCGGVRPRHLRLRRLARLYQNLYEIRMESGLPCRNECRLKDVPE